MNFLDYTGKFHVNENEKNKCSFFFKNNVQFENKEYICIVPPVYDVGFKKIFSYSYGGIESARDFLNSLIYPDSKAITSLKYLPKEILSDSHLKYNKGSLIVDNAYLATIEYKDESGNEYKKEVIIDIEMQKNNFGDTFNERCFDYGTGLRNGHDHKETWVIALCFDNSKNPSYDKGAYSYFVKQLNLGKTQDKKNYVKIYEIYLNYLYNEQEPKALIENKKIGLIGKEWIKLFCLSLWCDSLDNDGINYLIPSEISFEGTEIKNAINILRFLDSLEKQRAQSLLFEEKKNLEEQYDKGFAEGRQEGISQGYDNCLIQIIDKYFNLFKSNQPIDGIEILGKIKLSLLQKKYKNEPFLGNFLDYLLDKNMLDFD